MSLSDNERCSEGHWKDKECGNNKEGRMAGLVSHLDVWTTFTKHQLPPAEPNPACPQSSSAQAHQSPSKLTFYCSSCSFFVHDTYLIILITWNLTSTMMNFDKSNTVQFLQATRGHMAAHAIGIQRCMIFKMTDIIRRTVRYAIEYTDYRAGSR
jgi:hypothetical protein